ncbi:Helitron helicase [Phytophthora megakarya]|uniref:Helitron helicase n=1 Tax=Phytophthora megakarya TaxID=4795 RepID=A0A225VUF7_9STRA|nr:Helitron helicase [Phytophthora megakarya]
MNFFRTRLSYTRFRMRLNALLDDITKNGILGKVAALVYVVEFQRGPHAHILINLKDHWKPRSSSDYDKFVSAGILDTELFPERHATVTTCMSHGPCGRGIISPAPEKTEYVPNDFVTISWMKRDICTTTCAKGKITQPLILGNEGGAMVMMKIIPRNNVSMKLSSTWMQGTYRPLKHAGQFSNMRCKTNMIISNDCLSTMKANSTYVSLPMLEFRILNSPGTDITRRLLYHEVPNHFVWVKVGYRYVWQPRQRGGDKAIGRLISMSPRDISRPKSFEDFKTVDGVVMESYKAADLSLGFLEYDEEIHRCLMEASAFQMPRKLSHLFCGFVGLL